MYTCGILLPRFCDMYDIIKREHCKTLWAHKTGKLHFIEYKRGFCARNLWKSINADKILFQLGCGRSAFKYWFGSTNADLNMNSSSINLFFYSGKNYHNGFIDGLLFIYIFIYTIKSIESFIFLLLPILFFRFDILLVANVNFKEKNSFA